MLVALKTDHWTGLCQRYKTDSYSNLRKLGLLHVARVPNVVAFCRYITQRHYDAIRVFMNERVKQLRLVACNQDICPQCYSSEIRIIAREGVAVCTRCGLMTRNLIEGIDDPSHIARTLPRCHSNNLYKRISHFRYWLDRLQGKERCHITHEEFQSIERLLLRRPSTTICDTTIRQILRELKLQRYYNNTYYIIRQLTGSALVEFDPPHETELMEMFRRIQLPFSSNRGIRVNMLAYPYLIRKFCEILGWEEIATQIYSMRSTEKLRQQDLIWRRICDELQWPFYRSV